MPSETDFRTIRADGRRSQSSRGGLCTLQAVASPGMPGAGRKLQRMDLVERHTTTVVRHPWEVSRAKLFMRLLNRVVPATPPEQWLDFGSGVAWLAEESLGTRPGGYRIGVEGTKGCRWTLS